MKLLLVTKEDWKNANWVIRILNATFNLISLLFIFITILELIDWLLI